MIFYLGIEGGKTLLLVVFCDIREWFLVKLMAETCSLYAKHRSIYSAGQKNKGVDFGWITTGFQPYGNVKKKFNRI